MIQLTRTTCRSDADPGALADYIIALLKHEKPPAELKTFCISQLEDFLHSSNPLLESSTNLLFQIRAGLLKGYSEG